MVKDFKIFNKKISLNSEPFIIAEIGVNHNGSLKLAKKLIDLAKLNKAHCVKFQTYNPKNLVSNNAKKAPYQIKNTKQKKESQFDMLKKLQLSYPDHLELVRYCKIKKMIFLSTPYNFEDVDLLERLNVPAFKLASMHLTELSFIEYVAKKRKPVILSTGMSDIKQIKEAVIILKRYLNNKFILMQCTTDYPAKINEANINVLKEFKKLFKCHLGYSDHTESNVSAISAISLGAVAIEKHITLNKRLPGPDHKCSLNPKEFSNYTKDILAAKISLGSSKKKISLNEKKNVKFMRRSIYSKEYIKKGKKISLSDLEFKRPENGIPSSKAKNILGAVATKDIFSNTLLNKNFFKFK